MGKIIFEFNIDNIIDIITNSSSELFIIEGESSEIISDMVTNVYSDYLDEYTEPRLLKDCSVDEIETLLYRKFNNFLYEKDASIDKIETIKEINKEDLFIYNTWGNGEKYIELNTEWIENNKELVSKEIDPESSKYMMFSLHDNPNHEMAKKLSEIGNRVYLG